MLEVDPWCHFNGAPLNAAQAWYSSLCWEKFPARPRLYVYNRHKYAVAGTAFHVSAWSGSLVPLSGDSLECRTSVLQWSCWEKHPVKQRHYVYSGRKYDDVGTAFHLSAWSDL